jgi:intein-encoded DNA endonuclease-like protein
MPKVLFSRADFDTHFSYIAGAILGDGHLRNYKYRHQDHYNREIGLCLSNTDKAFVEEFATHIIALIGPSAARIRAYNVPHYKTRYSYKRNSKFLYDLLNHPLPELAPDIRQPLHFLKGIFDSEGCVYYHLSSPNRLYKNLSITTTNDELKTLMTKILTTEGIHFTIYLQKTSKRMMRDGHLLIPNTPIAYCIQIRAKDDIIRFAEIMPNLIPRKQKKLEQLLNLMSGRGRIDVTTGHRLWSADARSKLSVTKKEWWRAKHAKGSF